MNMKLLKRSRSAPTVGDIFVYQMPDNLFRFGRVIRDDARMMAWKGLFVLYFYQAESETKRPVPRLDKGDLLIPPRITDRGAWTRGYFETVEQRRLEEEDTVSTHCFQDDDQYCDEYGNRLARRSEPCGFYGLTTECGIDNALTRALGFLLSPPNPKYLMGKPRAVYKQRFETLLSLGESSEVAETEGLKAATRHSGEKVEEYAWAELAKDIKLPAHSLPPPNPKYFSGDAYDAYQELLSAALSKGMPREVAEIEALKGMVRWWGEDIENYRWPDLNESTRTTKRRARGAR